MHLCDGLKTSQLLFSRYRWTSRERERLTTAAGFSLPGQLPLSGPGPLSGGKRALNRGFSCRSAHVRGCIRRTSCHPQHSLTAIRLKPRCCGPTAHPKPHPSRTKQHAAVHLIHKVNTATRLLHCFYKTAYVSVLFTWLKIIINKKKTPHANSRPASSRVSSRWHRSTGAASSTGLFQVSENPADAFCLLWALIMKWTCIFNRRPEWVSTSWRGGGGEVSRSHLGVSKRKAFQHFTCRLGIH